MVRLVRLRFFCHLLFGRILSRSQPHGPTPSCRGGLCDRLFHAATGFVNNGAPGCSSWPPYGPNYFSCNHGNGLLDHCVRPDLCYHWHLVAPEFDCHPLIAGACRSGANTEPQRPTCRKWPVRTAAAFTLPFNMSP